MFASRWRTAPVALAAGVLLLAGPAMDTRADEGDVSPEALRILKGMLDFIGGLQSFTLETENSLDEVLDSEQKIQHDFAAEIAIRRPNGIRAEQEGDLLDQIIVYDGKKLSIADREAGYHASVDAPDNIDDALHFARDALDLVPPSGDLVFSNAFELLTTNLQSASVVGKSFLGGVRCDHLAFRNARVDWQIWIAEGDRPLPLKYVLTTRDDPAQPQFIVRMKDWNVDPKLDEALFRFDPPAGSKPIDFIRMDQAYDFGRQGVQ